MDAVIISTLDRWTIFAKSHYVAVQSVEMFIASISFLSMLPCLFIIAKTGTLHWNCKTLLMCSAIVQLQIIVMQICVISYEFYTGVHMPLESGEEAMLMFAHEIGYGLSSVLSVYLVVERAIALRNVATYGDRKASTSVIVMLSFVAILFAVPWAYLGDVGGHYYIGIGVILSVEIPMVVCSFILYAYSRNKYVLMNECSLSIRYQMAEIFEYARAVIPVVVSSSFMKSCSLIACVLWQEGYGEYGVLRIFFFTIHTLNCVIMKTMLIAFHRGLRRTFWHFFSRNEHSTERRVSVKPKAVNDETEAYFRNLKAMWA